MKNIFLTVFFLFSANLAHAETLKGTFTRGFERYDLIVDKKDEYFIEDPKNLISKLEVNKKNSKSFTASFPLCVEGKVYKKGGYGPSGKYRKKVRVSKICK